jgi:hypothetical protein
MADGWRARKEKAAAEPQVRRVTGVKGARDSAKGRTACPCVLFG